MASLKFAQGALTEALAQDDAARAALADHAFHRQIGEAAGNPYLAQALDRMLVDHTRLGQGLYRPASKKERKILKKALQHHETLIAAIEAQDAEAAITAALDHWALSQDDISRAITPEPVPHDIAAAAEP